VDGSPDPILLVCPQVAERHGLRGHLFLVVGFGYIVGQSAFWARSRNPPRVNLIRSTSKDK
jgi:hypothetical protein